MSKCKPEGRGDEYCPHCGSARKYSEQHDAYYCPKCLYWLEKICPNRICEFCKDRPKYPAVNQK